MSCAVVYAPFQAGGLVQWWGSEAVTTAVASGTLLDPIAKRLRVARGLFLGLHDANNLFLKESLLCVAWAI